MPFSDRLDRWPRIKHAYLLGIGWWAVLVAAWSLLSSADLLISRLSDKATQDKWSAIWLHPTWGWKTWLVGVCVITTIVIFEGSYRKAHKRHREFNDELATVVAKKDEEFDAIVRMKDGELKQMVIENAEQYRQVVNAKEKEIETLTKRYGAVIAQKDAELKHLSKPSDCPIVRIYQWLNFIAGEHGIYSDSGFFLYNEGQTAYELRMEEFAVGPYVVKAQELSHVVGDGRGNGQLLVWLDGLSAIGGMKWNLPGAFKVASKGKDTAKYIVKVLLTYRDHRDLWYRTSQDVVYTIEDEEIGFGAVSHECLGLTRPEQVACTPDVRTGEA